MILKEDVLHVVSEKDIMEHYWGKTLTDNKPVYRNPTRSDCKGSCYFRWVRGKYIFHDRARGITANFDCFKHVMWTYNCNFVEALHRINGDMRLNLESKTFDSKPGRRTAKIPKNYTSRKVNFKIKTREWRQEDFDYWKQYHITLDSLNKIVKPVKSYKSDGGGSFNFKLKYKHTPHNPCYCYFFKTKALRVKMYQPMSKDQKWRSNTNVGDIFGWNNIDYTKSSLYIASGGKDMMCMWEMGYNTIAPISESTEIPEKYMNELMPNFKNIYVIYDNDNTGIEMSKKFCKKYNLTNIILPKNENLKDVADFCKNFGLKQTIKIIENVKRKNIENRKTTCGTT